MQVESLEEEVNQINNFMNIDEFENQKKKQQEALNRLAQLDEEMELLIIKHEPHPPRELGWGKGKDE